MFNGILGSPLTKYYAWFTVFAGIGIILAAVYTLNMIRKVFYGNTNNLTATITDIRWVERIALGLIVILIFWLGVYPQSLLNVTNEISDAILKKTDVLPLLGRH
jgi:NADH-quinone oxidoreductase subunit M